MQKVIGPYEMLEQLGSGGMGVVYRARDTRLQREVAIKVLSEAFLGPGTPGHATHERFLREARSASSLNHPNICTIYDVGEQDGNPYLVMELLQGRTLKDALRGVPMPLPEALEFAIQIARGLEEAHEAGIVHRDIKPANVFIVRKQQGTQQAKILDFGLAKQLQASVVSDATSDSTGVAETAAGHSLTMPGSTVGTVAYMSPEQARGEALDARSDLFSLGSVIYEMATGKLPFPGTATADVFAALLMKDPEPPRKLNPAVSKEGERIILKLLAKDKSRRYQTATEVRTDLEQLSARSGSSRTATASTGLQAAPPRRFPVLTVAGGVLAILVAAGGYFLWHARRSGGPAAGTASSSAAPINEKDSIILSDFTNETGDPVFDTTLNQALAIQLEQSPFLNIVSEEHLRQSLKYLGKSSEDKITPEIAREIGIREGIKAIITGSIAKLGNEYIVTLEAQSTNTGDSIAREQARAVDKDHVLTALDQATTALRGRLGESLSSIQNLETPFGQATTPSLEAFRAYALGDVEHAKANDIPEAAGHYKRAIELDPKFAMAWARLGVVYENSGQLSKATDCFQKAYDLSGAVSEREKLYIAGHYYSNVQGDMPKVIETLELATRTYPRSIDYWINLAVAYVIIGDFDRSAATIQRALAIQPDDGVAQEDYIQGLLIQDKLHEMQSALAELKKTGGGNTTGVRMPALQMYFILGDQAGMEQEMDWARGRPDGYLLTFGLAVTREFAGRYREAGSLYETAATQAEEQKAQDAAAFYLLSEASGLALAEECKEVPRLVKRALAIDHSKLTVRAAGLPAALCGEAKPILSALEAQTKIFPQDTLLNTLSLPLTRTADDLAHHRPEEALNDLQPMGNYNFISQQEYFRGLALLELKDPANAASAFRKVLTYKGATLFNTLQDYPQAQLGLARALAMQGDTAGAKQAYHDFFNTWKDADPTLPQLVQAKVEFGALK